MGNRIVGFGVWCVLGLVGCSSEGVQPQQGARAGEVAVNEEALNLLCSANQQCSDGHACTIDLCVAGICVHGPDLGCCESDDDCSTDVSCSVVSCVLNSCVETPILGCGDTEAASTTDADTSDDLLGVLCGSDTDCEDGDPCTDDVCLVGGVCLFASNPLCCDTAEDCDGVLACHTGACVDNRCSLTALPDCGDDAGAQSGPATSEAPTSEPATGEPATTSGPDATSGAATTDGSDVTSASPDTDGVTSESVTTSDAEMTTSGLATDVAPVPSGEASTSGPATTGGGDVSSEPPSPDGVTSESTATSDGETASEPLDTADSDVTDSVSDAPPSTSDDGRTTKPAMGDPWNDPMPVLTPFASSSGSTQSSDPASTGDAGVDDNFDDESTEHEVDDADDHASTGTTLMTSRLTGGACAMSAGGGETLRLGWVGFALIAGLIGRRRK